MSTVKSVTSNRSRQHITTKYINPHKSTALTSILIQTRLNTQTQNQNAIKFEPQKQNSCDLDDMLAQNNIHAH